MGFATFNKSLFGHNIEKISIDKSVDIIFVSDLFEKDYPQGGAEKSSEALIGSSPFRVQKIHSKDVDIKLLEDGVSKYWIFGNFFSLDFNLIPSIIANLKYSIIEYDYKFCKLRLPQKHRLTEEKECDCHNDIHGKIVSSFFYGAKSIFWMAEKQKDIYFELFPFLKEIENMVLSSVFDEKFFAKIKILRDKYKNLNKTHWAFIQSPNWVKGSDASKSFLDEAGLPYIALGGLSYDETLDKIARCKGLVALPNGVDTCPRAVIEAKLLGCELKLNDNVQHKDEIWWDTDDLLDTESYLYMSRQRFWQNIKSSMEYNPKLSGFLCVRNTNIQNYPWKECINSLLGVENPFCDEVVVVDSSDFKGEKSVDWTWEELVEWKDKEPRLKIHHIDRDYTCERFALFDGMNKALALSMISNDYAIYMDADEIVHEDDYEKINKLLKSWPRGLPGVSLPVIEPWGSKDKIRMDINPEKWRLISLKDCPATTFGVPEKLKKYDENGRLYALGSDGAFLIHQNSGDVLPFAGVMNENLLNLKQKALNWDLDAINKFEKIFNQIIDEIGGIWHFGWWDLTGGKTFETKIKRYIGREEDKGFYGWVRHWKSLYNQNLDDTPETNPFMDKKMSEMTDADIKNLAKKMKDCGGHIFHNKFDENKKNPTIRVNKKLPKVVSFDAKN